MRLLGSIEGSQIQGFTAQANFGVPLPTLGFVRPKQARGRITPRSTHVFLICLTCGVSQVFEHIAMLNTIAMVNQTVWP